MTEGGVSFGGDLNGDFIQGDKIGTQINGDVENLTIGEMSETDKIAQVEKVFDEVRDQVDDDFPEYESEGGEQAYSMLPDNEVADSPKSLVDDMKADAVAEINGDISVPSEGTPEFEEQKKTVYERLKAMAPAALKISLGIGSAVLATYVKTSPTVAGLQALITGLQEVASDGS